ncbi:MAG: hypothetical protein LBG62_05600 [Candidatus Methanoplasma sp.]|jgi:NADH:ubiquinone oxidoreductase subunit 6 (subunit J)|nr:hypothetical protein [Candidatus Methanoplasma sp.]
MNKKALLGAIASVALLAVLVGAVAATQWSDYTQSDSPQSVPFDGVDGDSGDIDHGSINYALFETYGPLLLVVALLMFGAMIGGICIAKEEAERDDSD